MANVVIDQALKSDQLVDITTIGRKTGEPRRIEIAFHYFDGKNYISGTPGKRGWYANLVAHPQFTLHLKQTVQADLPARAIPITDEATRRSILGQLVRKWQREGELEAFVANSPLVQVVVQP